MHKRAEVSGLRRFIVAFGVAGALLAVATQAGCRDRARAGKYPVSGTVTWNGEPIPTGFVTFHPADGKSDEAGAIERGRFSFYAHPGANRVSIRAEKVVGFNEAMNQPNMVQYLPPQYNTESTLSAEVSADGENAYEFRLTGEDAGS